MQYVSFSLTAPASCVGLIVEWKKCVAPAGPHHWLLLQDTEEKLDLM